MTEQTVMEGIQDAIQAMTQFEFSDVVINDWSVLDDSGQRAPYVIIENSDTFNSFQGTVSAEDSWEIVVNLVYYLGDVSWKQGMDGFRNTRQAIIDTFNAAGTGRSAGGLEATHISNIRSETPITYIFPHGIDPEFEPEAVPIFVAQAMVFETMEF